jgi:ceramide glucosyltransferase
VPVVRAFLAAHPEISARLVWTTPPRGDVLNPKVAQLIDLTRVARGSVLVVSDANVRVSPSYLRSLVSCLLRPGVGLVSSRIVGTGERGFGAAREKAQLGASIAPAVVAAHVLAGRPVTVGKSMAMRRVDLAQVGGWESVAGVLAEDDVLGQRFHERGYAVELCLEPVENRNVSCSTRRSLERHTRWARMRRALVPAFFHLEPLLQPILVALVVALCAPSPVALRALGAALLTQVVFALAAHAIAGARRPLLLAALEPLRALASAACHLSALASMRVQWRSNAFSVEAGSKLRPAEEREASRRRGVAAT